MKPPTDETQHMSETQPQPKAPCDHENLEFREAEVSGGSLLIHLCCRECSLFSAHLIDPDDVSWPADPTPWVEKACIHEFAMTCSDGTYRCPICKAEWGEPNAPATS
jgi:hypothetical protein